MKTILSKLLSLVLIFNLLALPTLAMPELDYSVDENIRRNYNPNKIEEDVLPPLPSSLSQTESKTQTYKPTVQTPTYSAPKTTGKFATIKQGTKFKVKLATHLNDHSPKGGGITFISMYPVTTTYLTIPAGTHFKGTVIDSHPAQLTGNGGLLVIKVNSLILNNSLQPINAYITKANSKKIFFNNIKGKRTYMRSVINSTTPGHKFMQKMWNITKDLANDGNVITWILTPFSLASGVIVYGFNVMMSPVFGMFSKGGNLAIPAGTVWEIKLIDDLNIYY